ncbi:conserved hypothetical protein [Pyrenophora tritici-repentis Pt-1C-BFP]|uniref:Uncharacterized protein n=1 Tax=Pyrenophora tritici-repentis (strain Pt-1C-BFP) TaxID=426418 RepID=B2W2B4_PYRTR|nr:uncharacterized protein PTRG_03562 [Pyrenophora tritici-repentis Pt-1C-BFP]EDU46400.1 conserved hypothetical protein [Pyrenophora tritici-repentis Pt-1C-BFP]
METTMDWDGFEKQARSVAPKTPLDPRGVSIEKIQRAYRQHFDLAAVRLSFKGQLVDQNDSVSSYLAPNDDLVFFTVDQARQSSEHSQPARHRERSTMEHESQQQPREISESSTSTLTIRTASLTRTSPERCIEKPGRLGIKEENASVPSVVQDTSKEAANAFDPNNVFHRERSLDGIRQAQGASYDSVLRQIIEQRDPDILEAGVNASTEIIKRLRQKFSQYAESNADSKAWMNAIENVLQQTVRTRTIVGVVGNTGAGKSSVINAMLDEERLVPTNCMRACTAVVTEISFNEDVDPSSKYRAEIEFISSEDWERELTVLMQEFTDNGTLSREAVNPNSEAGVAWAKFHAVYPCVTKDALWKHTITELVNKQSVVNTLGTVKYIRAAQPERFHQELQRYVDSKEKVSKKDKEKPKISVPKAARVMEYWPLIKVVRIYTKSPALSTGAVIVDLPGVHDSNAARAAVAQGYLKQCTGLWIVAPINRAVDDKAAKTLLGDSFKRQLKYDGGFSNMTFICSKTDDISVTEASDSLGLEDEVSELNKRYEHCDEQIRQVHAKIEDLKETRQVYKLAIAEIAKDIEIWEDFQEQIEDGIPVFAPLPKTSKRKDTSLDRRPSKKPRTFEENSDDEFIASDEDKSSEGDDNDVTILVARQKLTETDVKSKLKDLRETKKTARSEGTEINKMIEALRAEILRACFKEMRHCVKTQVNDKYPELINEAVKAAPVTAYAWGYKDQGGLPWSTYKAVVRRDGVYRSMSAGHRDFNSDLVDPILKRLATPWERTFQSHLPGKIETHIENSAKLLHKFHEAIQERGNDSGMSLAKISILKGQLTHYEQFLRDFGMDLINQMNELQREANRDFTPCVAMAMHDAYEYCAMEHGKGSYKRMKDHMEDHVKQESPGMFDEATSKVEKHLDDMCTKLREAMEEKAEWFAARMGTDYMRVMSGVASDQPVPLLSEEESQLRDEVREALSSIVVQLEPIAHGDVGSHHGDTGDGSKAHKPLHAYVEDVDMSESAEEPIRGAHDSSITDEAINSVKPTDNGSSIIVEATNNFKPNTVVNESINSGKPMGNDSTAMEA